MDQPNFAGDYDVLLDLVKSRASVRKLKPDPIPDDYVTQILEVGRWAMSGANGQPWDFIVVESRHQEGAVPRLHRGKQRLHLLDGAAARFQAASSVLPDDA
jgi:nitroreductase